MSMKDDHLEYDSVQHENHEVIKKLQIRSIHKLIERFNIEVQILNWYSPSTISHPNHHLLKSQRLVQAEFKFLQEKECEST